MQSAMLALLVLASMVGCGSKDEVLGSGSAPIFVKEPIRLGDSSSPRDISKEGPFTQVQIVCESDRDFGLILPTSQQATGTRNRDTFRKEEQGILTAPSILGVRNRVARILAFENGSPFYTDYSFALAREIGERNKIAIQDLGAGPSARYFDFARSRHAAASPDRKAFVTPTKAGLELRAVSEPAKVLASFPLNGKFVNPRWEPKANGESEIFLDGLDKTQGWLQLGADYSQKKWELMPKSKAEQIGLRRLDDSSVIWLEWKPTKSVLKILKNKKVREVAVPGEQKFGAGFALFQRNGGEKEVVLQSKMGVHFFSFREDDLKETYVATYSPSVSDNIRRNFPEWNPGAIYSLANDSQLLVTLPTTFGKILFVLDDGKFFRQLGHDTCVNPDFYPELE